VTYFEPGTYRLQNANTAWDYQTDGNTMRFELRSGDHWANDRSGVERSEIASYKKLDIGKTYTVSYKFMVEPGQPNSADWLVLGQLHSTEDSYDSGVSPPSGINLIGERMEIHVRWSTPARTDWSNVKTKSLYTDAQNIKRGHWYDIKMTVKFDPFGNGILDIWRDGDQLVNYRGPLGYNDKIGPYWKHGVYREASRESIAVNYSDFSLKEGAAAQPPAPPLPPAPTGTKHGTAGHDVIHGASTRDSIYGGNGNDNLYGEAGNDFLNGEAGNDIMYGGAGNDVLHGLVGNDYLFGGDGNDRIVTGKGQNHLTGGKGADVFDFNALDQKRSAYSMITDFRHGVDKIDLFDMDAKTTVSGNQAFTFIGKKGFSGKAGELRFSGETLSADVNGDKVADFHVRMPLAKITASDLIL
jgi:Ca2+-binding RTX toxin-like protein